MVFLILKVNKFYHWRIVYRNHILDLKTAYVEDYLLTHKSFSFMDLMEKQRSKMEIIVTFMVILELMKTGKITIVQEDIFDDIWITSKAG